jgi:MFS superfamily sulfate permease-like transporter
MLIFFASWAATFYLNIEAGILVCILLSILFILSKTTDVQISLLGRVRYSYKDRRDVYKQSDAYVDVKDYPAAQMVENVLILSLRNSLEFFNSGNLRKRIQVFFILILDVSR